MSTGYDCIYFVPMRQNAKTDANAECCSKHLNPLSGSEVFEYLGIQTKSNRKPHGNLSRPSVIRFRCLVDVSKLLLQERSDFSIYHQLIPKK